MNRKNRQRVIDAATYQNHIASSEHILSHCFFTLTYPGKRFNDANKDIGRFLDKLSKHATRIYPEIGDKFSYIWVRELTKKGLDHFHVMSVLPVFRLDEKKHPAIDYSIPFYYPGEDKDRFYSLNKSWCDTIGYYSPNAVRISREKRPGDAPGKPTGKSLFVIDDLAAAIRYVAKYCSKGQTDDEGNQITSSKPVMRMSRNLSKWTKPLKYDDALGFVFDPYYGDKYDFDPDKATEMIRNGELSPDGRVINTDFAKIGRVQLSKAASLFFKLHQYQVEQDIKHLEHARKMKEFNAKIKRKQQEMSAQTKIFQ
tara:strand:- start:293 stop:1228 length:936 start_codon:yes stop_codon:yes gene_type:complete